MEIYTQMPDKATGDALKRLSDALDDHQGDGASAATDADESSDERGDDLGRIA